MKRLLVLLIVLGAAGGAGYWWYATHHASTTTTAGRGGRRGGGQNQPIPVTAAKAETRDVPIYLDGLGTVQAFNLVSVKAMIDGPLTQVTFTEGQDVKQGDVLARIDPRPYQASLDAATAKKQQDEATLANNRLDFARYTKLSPTLGSSQQQLDTSRAQVATQEAIVRGDQAQIDTARTNLSYTTIVAPFDGRTGIRQVDVGNIVHSSDSTPVTVITQLKPISVLFTLPQQALGPVSAALQKGKPVVLALAGGGGGALLDRGQLTVLDNQVDATTGTIKLKAAFPNDRLQLWPGGFVNVRLLVDTAKGVTTIPTAAVQRGPRGPFVFVINADKSVRRQTIGVGHEDEATSVITAGLKPGEEVVTDGAQRLNDNSKVAIAGPDGTAPDAIPPELRQPDTAQDRSTPDRSAPDRSAPGTRQRRQRTEG